MIDNHKVEMSLEVMLAHVIVSAAKTSRQHSTLGSGVIMAGPSWPNSMVQVILFGRL